MKPDNNFPPFNIDAIPLWLEPSLWDEEISLHHRGLKFITLYAVSTVINALMGFIPIACVSAYRSPNAIDGVLSAVFWWLVLSTPVGLLMGFVGWWDFRRACRKLARQKHEPHG